MRHWTQEERERQATLIRNWKPWLRSTGPTSDAGKGRVSQNALAHGAYSQQAKSTAAQIADFIRSCHETLNDIEK